MVAQISVVSNVIELQSEPNHRYVDDDSRHDSFYKEDTWECFKLVLLSVSRPLQRDYF